MLGILPGVIGVIQATETVKLILGTGRALIGRLLLYDALDMAFREMKVRKNPKCPICGPEPTITKLIDYEAFCGVEDRSSLLPSPAEAITPLELKAMFDRGDRPFLLDVRNPEEITICRIEGSTVIPLPELAGSDRRARPGPSRWSSIARAGPGARRRSRYLKEKGFTPPLEPDGRYPGLDQGRRPQPAIGY